MDFKDKRLMMSKEEVINRAKELLNENQEVLITKYMFLEQQCKKQKEVIDNAVKYISNKKAIINTDVIRIFDLFEIDEQGYTDELLKILNEVSK